MYDEVHEGDAVDAAAGGSVVFLGLEDAEVEGSAAAQSFGTDAFEAYVADVVVVAAVDGEESEAVGIVAQYVAVVDAYMAERLAIRVAVVAVGADIDGVCHVGPEDAVADLNVFAAAPVPPPMVVESNAVGPCFKGYIITEVVFRGLFKAFHQPVIECSP